MCEDDTCQPDSDADPITFDFASDEVYVNENADEEAKKAAAAAEMEEAHKKAMADMEAKFKAEAAANAALLADKEAAASALADQAAAAEGDAGK
jgi:membrane protein involved in colicin uptake